MNLIDVHAHLDLGEFDKDLDEVLEKCAKVGVKAIIANSVDQKSGERVLALAKKYQTIKAALGLYPVEAATMSEEAFQDTLSFIKKHKPIAIGEIGLDYQEVDESHRKTMEHRFRALVLLAKELNVPVLVHSRKAELRTIEVLEDIGHRKVVMHCFMGRKHLAQRVLDNTWYLSIPANVTYHEQFQQNTKMADMSRLLTETDTPYLSPERGARNDPSNVLHGIRKISELKGLTVEDAANIIYMNYQTLFL
ncbi:MAG: TatD family hydrolase [Nanoarchaeota archaeon]